LKINKEVKIPALEFRTKFKTKNGFKNLIAIEFSVKKFSIIVAVEIKGFHFLEEKVHQTDKE
jgi:hypothetical protein